MTHSQAQRYGAVAGLVVGLAIALAANLTYAIPRGPVVVGIGLVAPIVLPLVLWLRGVFVADTWPRKICREAAMILVAGPAVTISYVHTYSLVLAHEPSWPILALVAPLSSDGVGAMATMALHWSRQQQPGRKPSATKPGAAKPAQAKPKNLDAPAPEQTTPESPNEVESRRGQRTEMVAWIRDQDEFPSIKAVAARFDCHPTTAKRARNDARAAS